MKKKIIASLMVTLAAFFCASTVVLENAYASPTPTDTCNGGHFMGLRAWYDGLAEMVNGRCEVSPDKFKIDNNNSAEFTKNVWLVVLNIASMVTGIIGYLAICFVIWGGYQYMLAQGDPGKVVRGKKTIMNAIIGLVVCQLASIISGMVVDIATSARGGNVFVTAMTKAFTWAAIIAVIVIVTGGIQYVTSNGNPSAVQKAKQTIMYAAIGLVISLLAVAIVNFAIGALG